jgi:hypothetical protein
MTINLGIIDYADRPYGDPPVKKAIHIPCKCVHCQKMSVRTIDCPDRLQDAKPGSFVTIDADGRLQVREEP